MSYYLLGKSKKPKGPYELSQLRALWEAGKIPAGTRCCMKGGKKWLPIEDAFVVPSAAPKVIREKFKKKEEKTAISDEVYEETINGRCTHCDATIAFPADAVGAVADCPRCGRAVVLQPSFFARFSRGTRKFVRDSLQSIVLTIGFCSFVLTVHYIDEQTGLAGHNLFDPQDWRVGDSVKRWLTPEDVQEPGHPISDHPISDKMMGFIAMIMSLISMIMLIFLSLKIDHTGKLIGRGENWVSRDSVSGQGESVVFVCIKIILILFTSSFLLILICNIPWPLVGLGLFFLLIILSACSEGGGSGGGTVRGVYYKETDGGQDGGGGDFPGMG